LQPKPRKPWCHRNSAFTEAVSATPDPNSVEPLIVGGDIVCDEACKEATRYVRYHENPSPPHRRCCARRYSFRERTDTSAGPRSAGCRAADRRPGAATSRYSLSLSWHCASARISPWRRPLSLSWDLSRISTRPVPAEHCSTDGTGATGSAAFAACGPIATRLWRGSPCRLADTCPHQNRVRIAVGRLVGQ
jgi:hypothetical protein